jgi:hypothetical protein
MNLPHLFIPSNPGRWVSPSRAIGSLTGSHATSGFVGISETSKTPRSRVFAGVEAMRFVSLSVGEGLIRDGAVGLTSVD